MYINCFVTLDKKSEYHSNEPQKNPVASEPPISEAVVDQSVVGHSSVVLNPSVTSTNSCTAKQFTAVTTTNSTLMSMSGCSNPQISVPIVTSTETKKSEVVNGMDKEAHSEGSYV